MLSIASKILSIEHSKLADITKEEQTLQNSFENSKIYKFLTGKKDTIPEFQFDWIEPCAPALRFPHNWPSTPQAPPPAPATPVVQPSPEIQPPKDVQLLQPVHPAPAAPQPPVSHHELRPKEDIDYKELNSGIKSKCQSLQRKAQVVITMLAPGSFSPKHENASALGSKQ